MFGVPKYSAALEQIRQERNVEGLFNHNLVAVDHRRKVATFATGADGNKVEREFDLLHVVPPQVAPDFVKQSPLGASSDALSSASSSSFRARGTDSSVCALAHSRRRRVGRRRPGHDPVDQVRQRLLARRRVVAPQLEDGRRHFEPGTRPR